jgi:hypothetical protein
MSNDSSDFAYLDDLVVSGSMFKDKAFETFVRRFMQAHMQGFNVRILECGDPERWEFEQQYYVYEVDVTYRDTGVWGIDGDDVSMAALAAVADWCIENLGDVGEDYDATVFVVVDADGDLVDYEAIHDNEDDAQEVRDTAEDESFTGFPWAWNWSYFPDDWIEDETLQRAGFRVAQYRGGDDDEYRVCGIDGGGYDFTTSHYARLAALQYEANCMKVPTDNGDKHIKVR